MNQTKKRIGLISAMPIEMKNFEQAFKNSTTKFVKEQTFNIFESNFSDIITTVSLIGQVNAAFSTTLMIQEFNPDIILFFGVAGSLCESLQVGDVVIGNMIFSAEYLNTHISHIKCIYGTFPEYKYTGDINLLSIAKSLSLQSSLNVKEGNIVSSDYFPFPQYIPKVFEGVQLNICDMESAGFHQVCRLLKKPGLVIRGISNSANSIKNIKIKRNDIEKAARNAAEFTAEITHYFSLNSFK
jgi:adenosylhomocysteine nucleosidase